ncbi:MAG: BON domain-containing protein [Thermoguttaceae bacterium]|jgi:hypothetical protein
MKRMIFPCGLLFSALWAAGGTNISAQTTTVGPVLGQNGRFVPSASGILNPHIIEGRFGTSVQGSYLAPEINRPESRFSSNALMTPSGGFIGILSDADAARSNDLERREQEEELSEIDLLMLMRRMRNRALAEEQAEEPYTQRSAVPYSEQPAEPILPQPVQASPAEPVPPRFPPPPSDLPWAEPQAPSEQIWMRGSARMAAPSAQRQLQSGSHRWEEDFEIDPRWYEFGVSIDAGLSENMPTQEATPQNTSFQGTMPPQPEPFEEGMVIGGRLPEPVPRPNPTLPSDLLARNGRRERKRSAVVQEELETQLLKSPLVSPLAPIHVRLNGSTAVVTGIVGSDRARVEAGKILLLDSRVEQVDNRIVVYSDDGFTAENPAEGVPVAPAGNSTSGEE